MRIYWSSDEIKRQEDVVRSQLVTRLKKTREPVSPHDIIVAWKFQDRGGSTVSSEAVRYALWDLFESGDVEMTPSRKIVWRRRKEMPKSRTKRALAK